MQFSIKATEEERLYTQKIDSLHLKVHLIRFPWGIVTNGMLLNRQKINALLKSGLRAITISLDGMEESHNWLRGNAKSFSSALNAIRLLPEIPEIKYDVVTCVNQKNFSEGNGMHLRDEKTGELLFCHLKRIEEGENINRQH